MSTIKSNLEKMPSCLKIKIYDDQNYYCAKAVEKLTNSPIGDDLLEKIAQNNNYLKIVYDKNEHGKIEINNNKITITLGNNDFYYHTSALINEIPDSYIKYISPSCSFKKVADLCTPDDILFHELCHAANMADNLNNQVKRSRTQTLQKDLTNEEERITIEKTNDYLQELGKPKRVDHKASFYPPYHQMLHNQDANRIDLKSAFKNYLVNGLHVDALQISEHLSKEEIEDVLSKIDVFILNSEFFLEIFFSLIEKRDLNIDFSLPKWEVLLQACIILIPTSHQFEQLFQLKVNNKTLSQEKAQYIKDLTVELLNISDCNFNWIIKLCSAFTNDELLQIFLDLKNELYSSPHLSKILLLLFEERELKIDFIKDINLNLFYRQGINC